MKLSSPIGRSTGWWIISIMRLIFLLFGAFLFTAPIVAFAWWAFTHDPVFPDWWVGGLMGVLGLFVQLVAPKGPEDEK